MIVKRTSLFFLLLGALILAFIVGRSVGIKEFEEYMLYSEIQDAWARTALVDLAEERDCQKLRNRLFHISDLDATHEAGLVLYPDRFFSSVREDFRFFKQDFGGIQEIRRYAIDLLKLRYEKLNKNEFYSDSNDLAEIQEHINRLENLVK